MNRILLVACFVMAFVVAAVSFPDGAVGILLLIPCSAIVILLLRNYNDDSDFLVNIFLLALLARVAFATICNVFVLYDFFGRDVIIYDELGYRLAEFWGGRSAGDDGMTIRALSTTQPGWGMGYITGFVYLLCGRNILAGQFFCAVIGAATAPIVYICSYEIFSNKRVGKISAVLVALFPAFVVWSSQLLKDGVIIFLLVLTMAMVLKLQKKFTYTAVLTLAFCLFGVLSLRFYIFYIVGVAVAGSFIIGSGSSIKSIVRGFISMIFIGVVLTYVGALQSAGSNLEKYGSMERIQASRLDNVRTANSGYGEDIDVSTPMGALQAMPIGFTYLMFAPFPWQISNLRQAITLPEMLIWWFSLPVLISGLWFTIKTKLRQSIAILLFTLLLTIAYSVFQSNVGTAYRQRAQIQVFLFMFIAVGCTLVLERRENTKRANSLKQQELRQFPPPERFVPPDDDESADSDSSNKN